MNATARWSATGAEALAAEASRYLQAIEAFAALDADPYAQARARAAQARRSEDTRRERRRQLR